MFTSYSVCVCVWRGGGSERVRGVPLNVYILYTGCGRSHILILDKFPFFCCVVWKMKPEKKLYGGGKWLEGRVRRNMGSERERGGLRGDRGRGNIGSEGTCACPLHTNAMAAVLQC